MTADEAVKRGAEAGWALRQALNEICDDKSEVAIRAAVVALTLNETAGKACGPFEGKSRTGMLRGYGNAIVLPVAIAFVEAAMGVL